MKLFQLYDKTFQDEKFCFHAKDMQAAESRRHEWCGYHSYSTKDYDVNEVNAPKYRDGIKDEYFD